jgi:hypothetical protein
VIDIAWDILVGRGGQALLILLAYQTFGRVVKVLMQHGEVGYDLFSSIAFDSGSATSLVAIVRHAFGFTPIPRTRRAALIYGAMGAATLYIVVIPSLLAAMTGYTSYYAPTIETGVAFGVPETGNRDCFGAILPLWGMMQNITVGEYNALTWTLPKPYPVAYSYDQDWIDCEFYIYRTNDDNSNHVAREQTTTLTTTSTTRALLAQTFPTVKKLIRLRTLTLDTTESRFQVRCQV